MSVEGTLANNKMQQTSHGADGGSLLILVLSGPSQLISVFYAAEWTGRVSPPHS